MTPDEKARRQELRRTLPPYQWPKPTPGERVRGVWEWTKVALVIIAILWVMGALFGSGQSGSDVNCDNNPTACEPRDIQYPK